MGAKGKKGRPQADVEDSTGDKNDLVDSDNDDKISMPTKAKSKKDRKKRKEEELEEAQRELEKLNDGEDDDLVPMHDTKKIMEEHEPKSNKAKTKMSKKDKKVIINTYVVLIQRR